MLAEESAAVARQLEDAFNRHDAAFYDAHPGLTAPKVFYKKLWSAFPDMRATTEMTIVQEDWVAQRLMVSGTMQGDFMGMAPTGKSATYEVMVMFRVVEGKITEYYAQADVIDMTQQLGVVSGTAQ